MNTDGLTAGRELDRLIADKVMGLKVCVCDGTNLAIAWNGVGDATHFPGCGLPFVRNYSTDIAHAFEVLNQIATLRLGPEFHPDFAHNAPGNCRSGLYKPVIRLDLYEHDDEYTVTIGRCKGVGQDDDVTAQTMDVHGLTKGTSFAICLAAIKIMTKYKRV